MMTYCGGCQCGAVRFSITVPELIVYACHCQDCQKHTTSACALSIPVAISALEIEGPLSIFSRETDSGTTTDCHFCSTCGTRIYHQSARSRDMVTLKGGTLDDTRMLVPVAHLWVSRKQSWMQLPDDVPQFETQPDDLKAWRAGLISAS